ncbi:hypothetical protein [Sphingomonas sp. M1-B02]|uniref:hypothetical protein n=1 Tax=Sphingomonas sp. M1-B02 TaxID=3114300 RepID=UPI00223EEDF7|nr:hypothetical protein [Sphingomonas sp. S6-11]UZK65964.1 hypothetical protein OKW87_15870 [Sphingomonas sp. S6-11]
MNFFTQIDETQISRGAATAFDAFVPTHRRLFAIAQPTRKRRRRRARKAPALA